MQRSEESIEKYKEYILVVALIIQLLSGAVGGNLAGAILKHLSLGPIGNTIAGIVGGGIGGQILSALVSLGGAAVANNVDVGAILGQVAGGGVGGAVVMAIVGLLRRALAGRAA